MAGVKTGSGASKLVPLLLVLVLLCGYGAWNYQRNLEAEDSVPRPYKSYSDEQLDQLLLAYQAQLDALDRRYDAASSQRSRVVRDRSLLGEAVGEFERVQQTSRAVRELGSRASQEEASVKAIQAEQAIRARIGKGFDAFVRRAFLPPA
jgi:hypothetical protein